MSLEEPSELPSAPKWERMPGALRRRLDRAVAEHLRQHGGKHYDLLRDHPDFAPWIGAHLGTRGEKRLDRYISLVRARARARSMSDEPPPSRHSAAGSGDYLALEAGDRSFSDAVASVLSLEELQIETRRSLASINSEIAACRDDDGQLRDTGFYLKLLQERRAIVRQSVDLAERFSTRLSDPQVLDKIVARIFQEFPDEPDRRQSLKDDISKIFGDAGGLSIMQPGR